MWPDQRQAIEKVINILGHSEDFIEEILNEF